MAYEKPQLARVGAAAAIVLGPYPGRDLDHPGSGNNTSPFPVPLGLDD